MMFVPDPTEILFTKTVIFSRIRLFSMLDAAPEFLACTFYFSDLPKALSDQNPFVGSLSAQEPSMSSEWICRLSSKRHARLWR